MQQNELMHYGVLGMKWGKRKARPTSDVRKRYDAAKQNYKDAGKEYSKAYNKAYNYSSAHPISQYTNKKKSVEADRRWQDAVDKGHKSVKATQQFKQAKAERAQAIADKYTEIDKSTTKRDRLIYNNATRKKAAKYVVDHNMTIEEANKLAKKDAMRNTTALLAAYGTVTVATLYKMSH